MEMTLTVHVPRRRPHPVEVLVRWSGRHTAADLCARLGDHLGEPVEQLSTRGVAIPREAVVGEPPLLHGSAVTISARSAPPLEPPTRTAVLDVVVVGGPDAGHARPLSPPGLLVGRAPAAGLVIEDDALSRVHAAFGVGGAGVVVEDEGSTNGVVVDGRPTTGPCPVDASSTIVVGGSTLRLRRAVGRGVPVVATGDGRLTLPGQPRAPDAAGDPDPVDVECPAPPPERHRSRVPWVAALVPVPVGVGLAVFLGPQLLVFALLGPVMVLAGALGDRWGAGRAARRDADDHREAVRRARARLEHALADERIRLDRAHPDPHAALVAAEHRLTTLWCGGDRLPVRLGTGDVATRVAWLADGVRAHPAAARAPVVVSLVDVGCLGVVGPERATDAVLRSVLGQVVATQPPTRVAVAVASTRPVWQWCRRTPHGLPTTSVDEGLALAGSIEEGPTTRLLAVPADESGEHTDLVATARTAGWLAVVAAPHRASLPRGCGAVLLVGTAGGDVLETASGTSVPFVADGVGAWWAERLSRALAPLRCSTAPSGPGPASVPDEVSLDEVLPAGATLPQALVARWASATARGGGLSAPVAAVGVGPAGIHTVDLSRDGPHVLVGGTTGSGKSEFLRTLVTSLAVSSAPRDLALVLVDFKGGAAFGPCADLPHVVGLVTDLDDHLVSRALTSLRAELRRRERLFAEASVQDLEAYACSPGGRHRPVPRVVVVVDELRTLVDEVPEFVSGLVRLAAQGRSLGVHLVLATQRPAGVVTAEVQANVSLRIAFRVRDRADSVAVVDDGAAADIGPHTPGRAMARGADGRLRTFQSAILGPPGNGDGHAHLEVHPAGADGGDGGGGGGDGRPTRPPDARAGQSRPDRVLHTAELVGAITAAHRLSGRTAPTPPWLPPLPEHLTLASAAALVPAHGRGCGTAALGLVDEPDLQRVAPLTWRAEQGTWLLAGRPRSGRTNGLRALVAGAAAVHRSAALHVHLVDPATSLGDLAALPHVGTHVPGAELSAFTALVEHLRGLVASRRADGSTRASRPDARDPTVLVVVDGWEQLVEAFPEAAGADAVEGLVRVLRDGAAVGVVGAVAGGRGLLQPRWTGIGASTLVLGPLDPLDLALCGLRAADVPTAPPPGRGIRLEDRREVQFARVDGPDLRAIADAAPPEPRRAWRHRPLPQRIALPAGGVVRGVAPARHPLGIHGAEHHVWAWVPETHGRTLLVAGPAHSGRTNTLHVIAASVGASGRRVALVGRGLVEGPAPRVDSEALGVGAPASPEPGTVMTVDPTDVEALVAARRRDPRLAVLVDDADLLDGTPVAGVLREVLDLVDRDDGLVVVVGTPSRLASRFRGLDVAVARRGCGVLLRPGAGDGDLLGAPRVHGILAVPGRGVFVSAGVATELQVYLAPVEQGEESAVGADARDLVLGGRDRQRRHRGHGGEPQDGPPGHGLAALHETETHGHEQRAPHDGRRLGPGGPAEPPLGQRGEAEAPDEDEHGRHEHPRGVTALADHQLVEVERREPHERQGLEGGEPGGEAAGAG